MLGVPKTKASPIGQAFVFVSGTLRVYLPAGFFLLLGRLTVWVTVASGWRFTVEVLTKEPVTALRVTVEVFFFVAFFVAMASPLWSGCFADNRRWCQLPPLSTAGPRSAKVFGIALYR
jgi:hypothetical protein